MLITALLALAAAAQEPPASAAPAAPASMTDAALLALFDDVCTRGRDAPAGFRAVEWSSFPEALRFMNTYGHGGTFLRGEEGGRTAYIARTRGEGHLDPGTETRCGVAVQGASHDGLVAALGTRLRTRPVGPIVLGGLSNTLFVSDAGAVSVSQADGEWVIVRTFDMTIRRR